MTEINTYTENENIGSGVDFEKMERVLHSKYPLGYVLRNQIDKATGGLLKPRTMAARDCEGKGPEKIYVGNRVAYEISSLVCCMKKMIK